MAGTYVALAGATTLVITSGGSYTLYLASTVAAFASVAVALDLVMATTGLIIACQGSFFGIGAYTCAILVERAGLPFGLAAAAGVVGSGLVAAALGALTIRVGGMYFALSSMAFGVLITDVIALPKLTGLTGGEFGMNVQANFVQGHAALIVFVIILALSASLSWLLRRSWLGDRLRAIRDDEVLARSLGIRTTRYKLAVVIVSGAIAGLVGVFYAPFFRYLNTSEFDIWFSFNVLVWVLVGGVGTVAGPVVGSALLWTFPQVVSIQPALVLVSYGALLIVVILVYRGGVVGLAEWALRHLWSRLLPLWARVTPLRTPSGRAASSEAGRSGR